MTHDHSALIAQLDGLKGADSASVFAELIRAGMQALIDAEATEALGAGRYERAEGRTTYRNGSRAKTVATTSGDVELKIPKLRSGSFFPSLLERRRRIDRALHAVIMEAYVHGVSTRNVDDLVGALGVGSGISKSEVSRICGQLDTEIGRFRDRTLTHTTFPYVFLDATYCKVRVGAHVVSHALVVATGVSMDGTREVLGTAVGDSESFDFWREFLAGLRARGLCGVHLVISDAHAGLKAAVAQQFTGSSWQRCRVHFMRNLQSAVHSKHAPAVMAAVKTVFAHTDPDEVAAQWDQVTDTLAGSFPKVSSMMREAKCDVLAFSGFPRSHWQKIWSNNPIERLNKEIKRRADVVEIFPNPASFLRLATAVVIEAHDEWQVTRRYVSDVSMDELRTVIVAKERAAAQHATAESLTAELETA
ncbi:IS256-like element ISRo1 family transposase [Rhodococcus opacus]|uniref:Mutator family transposase n=1 Tax=Rhodococcus opacus TaxID=37919 RepID=P72303_RHOOP|nr:IS256-like element ISRo1 family transposase [Rhodococcus opacus]AAB57888.1 putative transposase [Rhodococcus opacus]MDX5961783.1 IS256-like element ISRo1 family transposase [Rhodococcus opacus]MDX5961853.1 IS256-like element ISRo1 family transposase [Rhodococcus opacus]MDX5962566.1 IS256-like element ISRo1 family transposase [Rhodococcus opacus]CAG7581842.1 IS256 family transposase ISRo1 [Rhodococcus opacus]